jgi:hypothetical protein
LTIAFLPQQGDSFPQPFTYPRLATRAYFLGTNSKRLTMLKKFPGSACTICSDINNFLKNEAEIITDFKTRIANTAREIDSLQAAAHITYNRIINKMNEAECMAFLSDKTLFMEENY